jgi:hypothetical protein
MTNKSYSDSQSPRASRDTTNDAEKFTKGAEQLGAKDTKDSMNDHAWSLQGTKATNQKDI